jgi:hypothetical protein
MVTTEFMIKMVIFRLKVEVVIMKRMCSLIWLIQQTA